jgi:hypothetical protein
LTTTLVAVHDATLQVQRIDALTYNGLPDEEHIRVEENFIELTHLVVALKREIAFMTLAFTGFSQQRVAIQKTIRAAAANKRRRFSTIAKN